MKKFAWLVQNFLKVVARILPARQSATFLMHLQRYLDELESYQATRFEGGIHPKHRLMDYHRFFYERVLPGERVLDIGSGKGELAYDIASKSDAQVVGIEISEKYVRYASAHFSHPKLSFVHGDVLTKLPADTYDVAVMSNVLEHLKDRVGFLRSVQSRVHPKRWLIRVPMYRRDWRVPFMDELGVDSRLDRTHYTEYLEDQLRSELAAAGLHITDMIINWGEFWCQATPISSTITV